MGRRDEDLSLVGALFDSLELTPTWFGPVFAGVAFLVLRYGVPLVVHPRAAGGVAGWALVIAEFSAWVVPLMIMTAWCGIEIRRWQDRRRLDGQTGLESIRELPWREFENLVAEAYRRQGFFAKVTGDSAGDGGVDIDMNRAAERVLVQCKQWRAFSVGVRPVRELLGVVASEGASRGIVVTSGRFTREAGRFARGSGKIELVDGVLLGELVSQVRRAGGAGKVAGSPLCPLCGGKMAVRVAKRGQRVGEKFWGCGSFPKCGGKRNIAS